MSIAYHATFTCGCTRLLSTQGIAGPVVAICTQHQKPPVKLTGGWIMDDYYPDETRYTLDLSKIAPFELSKFEPPKRKTEGIW